MHSQINIRTVGYNWNIFFSTVIFLLWCLHNLFNKGIYKAFCFTLYEPENAKTNQVMLTNRETIFKLKILIIVETVFKDNGALPSHPRFSGYAANMDSTLS